MAAVHRLLICRNYSSCFLPSYRAVTCLDAFYGVYSAACEKTGSEFRSNTYEMGKQIDPWRAHCSGDDVPYLYAALRRRVTRCDLGAVSGHSWSVVDLRSALCEAEISVLRSTCLKSI